MMPPDDKRRAEPKRLDPPDPRPRQSAQISRKHITVPAAWCENLTEEGRLLPEKWRVGKFERSTLLKSMHATIVDDIVHVAAALIDDAEPFGPDVDPIAAAIQAGDLWREIADDAASSAMALVLEAAGS